MTLNLSYNSDLSRVQIAITGLPSAVAAVTVERSLNGVYWVPVRGGIDLPVVGGAANLDDYEFATDVENFYRVTGPAAGLYLPGTSGAYASTPDHVSFDITGDIRLAAEAAPDLWVSGMTQPLISRITSAAGADRSWLLSARSAGEVGLSYSTTGTDLTARVSTVPVPFAAGERGAVAADLNADTGAGQHVVVLETSDGIAGPWAQLGGQVSNAPAITMHAGSRPVEVGASAGGTSTWPGVFFKGEVYNESDVLVADPDFTVHPTGTASFADSTGKTWTVHGSAMIVGDPVFTGSITPSLAGRVWLKSIRHPFLNRPVYRVLAGGGQEIGRGNRGGVVEVQGRSVPIAVTDVRSSKSFSLTVQVEDEDAAAVMDLVLASGDVFFIHVPPEMAPHVQGGYVTIGDSGQGRPADTVKWRFTLPCRVVMPPGPGIVGTTLTWGTVMNQFGSWEALLAAYPTWAELLASVGSPEDLVVIS